MTSKLPKVAEEKVQFFQPTPWALGDTGKVHTPVPQVIGTSKSTLWISEGHPVDRKTGDYRSGGPFHVTHSEVFCDPGSVTNVINGGITTPNRRYSGPVYGQFVPSIALESHYDGSTPESYDSSSMIADGTTAISQCAPNNPTANLSSTLAESFREGVPSLPGIQSWKNRVNILRAAGAEYLNAEFGWLPLKSEVNSVVNAARHHRDILQNYRHNEGRDVHRRFDFSSEKESWEEEISPASPVTGVLSTNYLNTSQPQSQRRVVVEKRRERWFEGCFTYGGPSKVDSFGRAIGFGSEADAVYGLNLSPDVLWNLTPWSWAVDWFSNAGDLIHNVSNFALAGLVMRYGYMMEETINSYYTEWGDGPFYSSTSMTSDKSKLITVREGAGRRGFRTTVKSRVPANPFGFGVGWEGLSPTQLAITAAIGITRSL